MGKVNRFLLMVIAMVVIMIAAVGIDKGMKYYEDRKWEKERIYHYEQARADIASIQTRISELSSDREAIEAFIEENKAYFDDMEVPGQDDTDQVRHEGDLAAEEDLSGNTLSGNDLSGNTVSGNDVSGNDLSGNSLSERDLSGNDLSGNTLSGNDLSGNDIIGEEPAEGEEVPGEDALKELTLAQRRRIRGSYEETILQSRQDRKTIAQATVDLSGLKIACLGDSITEAANLSSMEDYKQYSYPTKLGEILGTQNVTNLGIGGSSIGRYWDHAFVDRYQEIPADTDLIIVMGGTNDGFCLTNEDLGTFEERREKTFIGDLDELMRGLKENYPEAKIIFATPLPNVLHDMLRKERDYLLPQAVLAEDIKVLAAEYDYPVIDLYNSNILDSHDAAVIYNYMPDGVHCNEQGYELLAEHFAAELLRMYEAEEEESNS